MIIRLAKWCEEAESGLQIAGGEHLHIVKEQVQNGYAKLWRCESENSSAWVVTRYEPEINELVMVLGEGSGFFEFAPIFVERAKNAGLTIRVHTQRKGIVRMWSRLGVVFDEYVLRG